MGSDPLLLNKIAAAAIGALLIGMTAGFITGFVYQPKMLKQHVYAIDGGTITESPTDKKPKKSGPDPVAPLLAKADIGAGKKVSGKCTSCHTFSKGGKNKLGPNLWNIIGGKQGGNGQYKYSSAFKKLAGEWSYAEMNKFLWKPKAYVKGTKMSFAGLKKTGDRAALIAYMRSLSDAPKPLP
ncbi:MAG TPA: cytochrome c family protein [Rhodospirillaceae bacterium]|nr:cytochrome c family protein [Rhodospirillaceae bacterium]HAA92673.1 cytochrome c family protein [Rhodospirillaceae bacterium]HAT35404.1 cytochrome c family protein [Rhodospirillaceae bacterium]|tara:strand:+ start:382 stop:927 length:546 start_codon:yes stop_codon:yes gene_type:complete